MEAVLFAGEYHRSLTLFKHPFLQLLPHQRQTNFADIALEVIEIKLGTEPLVNPLEIIQTPRPALRVPFLHLRVARKNFPVELGDFFLGAFGVGAVCWRYEKQ